MPLHRSSWIERDVPCIVQQADHSVISGLLYTAMPRGDMVGTATFTDKSHQLIGEVVFGKVPGKEDEPLLQRSDALRAQICQLVLPEAARSASPEPTGATSSSVSPLSSQFHSMKQDCFWKTDCHSFQILQHNTVRSFGKCGEQKGNRHTEMQS